MHKIFLSVASMIVMHFLQKAFSKITEKPSDKEEVYRRMRAEYEARRAAARPVVAKMDSISTPRDGAKMMAAIGTVSDLRPCRPVEQANAMAMGSIGRF